MNTGDKKLREVGVTEACAYLAGVVDENHHNHPIIYAVGGLGGSVCVVARGAHKAFDLDDLDAAFACYREALAANGYDPNG